MNTTERRVISDLLIQIDIGSAQQINSPKYLIGAHHTRIRSDILNKNINIAVFDKLDPRKKNVEIDDQRHPRDSSLMRYAATDHIEQHRTSKFFSKKISENQN